MRFLAAVLSLGGVLASCNGESRLPEGPEPPAFPPATPAGLTVAPAGAHRLLVDWNDVPGATSYFLERRVSGGDVVKGPGFVSSSRYLDDVLQGRQSYVYRVAAVNAAGFSEFTEDVTGTATQIAGGAPLALLTGTVRTDRRLTADSLYLLRDQLFVISPATLTIGPGTTVLGDFDFDSWLVVTHGARLVAEGASDRPIVFTSAQDPGFRRPGDWGGITFLGRAPVNCAGGRCFDPEIGPRELPFGGADPGESSGVLRHVRIEFAGNPVPAAPGGRTALVLGAVGAGTTLDFVQVHRPLGKGVVFHGGAVDARHLLVSGSDGVGFAWDSGWMGRGQFWIAQAAVGLRGENDPAATDAIPPSSPVLSNLTIVSCPGGSGRFDGEPALHLLSGTAGTVVNALVRAETGPAFDLDGRATFERARDGSLGVVGTLFSGESPLFGGDVDGFDEGAFALAPARGNVVADGLLHPSSCATLDPNFEPVAGSPALEGARSLPADGFFSNVPYRGAVGAGDAWWRDWTSFVPD